ncbi:MAG: serine hydrolase, partial [Caulobacteraceae bacterium]|nr:serine hydrolase [Caulobacteraceae bacterium]
APAPVVAALPGARLAATTPIPPAELEALVDGVVRQSMARDHIAGVEVAVVQTGQVVLKKGYGFAAPGRLVDPDATLFRIGSISKTFTWIALMKEAEAGRIRLDTPVNLYLPEALQVRDQGFRQPVLVRDLLGHSAGFADRILGVLVEKDPNRVRPLALFLREERARRVREPGVLPTYSNYGAALAGESVSWVEGRPYQDVIEGEITRPLQMAHTTFREPYPARGDLPPPMPGALAGGVSSGYLWTGAGFQPQAFEYLTQVAPAASASSTAGDMARYMLMILNNGSLEAASIYGADTARGFRTPRLAGAPGVSGIDDGFLEFAFPGGFRGQGHAGDTLWFHSEMVTIPALNLGVFVTANTDTGGALAASLPERIVERFYAAPQALPRPGSAELAAQGAVYDGAYLTTRRPYGGLGLFNTLLKGPMQVRVTGDGRLVTEGGENPGAWVPDGPAGRFIQTMGSEVSAFRIENGRAVRWYAPSGVVAYDRVGPLRQLPALQIAAALAALASIATIVGLFTRDRREFRQTPMQARAGQVQTAIAALWLVAMALAAAYGFEARNPAYAMYAWPGPFVLVGSACALVAALLTGLTVLMAPAVWRGGRRVDSWTAWRKLRFTVSTLVFACFSALLAYWGALEPWSG